MKAQQTEAKTRRSWRTLSKRGRGGVGDSLAGVLERTTSVVLQLERQAGEAAVQPLLADFEQVRGARAAGVRVTIAGLRDRVAAVRRAVEAGAAVSEAERLRFREIEGRLHEAHWLARQAAQRATAAAMDLQRLCAVTSDMDEFIDVLLGLGTRTSELVQGRRIAA